MSSRSPSVSLAGRALLVLSMAGFACTGTIAGDSKGGGNRNPPDVTTGAGGSGGSGTGGSGGAGGGTERPPPPPGGFCQTVDPGPSPMRLLTKTEYANTVRDLFGSVAPGDVTAMFEFPEDARPVGGYSNDISRPASDALVEKYGRAAEKLATLAAGQMSTLLGGCDGARDPNGCIDKFLDTFGKRAWRRPLQAAEKANLARAFTEGTMRGKGFADGFTALVEVMLMSPQFLYRYEQGIDVPGTKYARLTSWEVASRLSYLLWGTMPDADLMSAAEAGKLSKPEEILAQAKRLAADPRHVPVFKNFMQELLHIEHLTTLEKDPELTTWQANLRAPMFEETNRFIEALFSKDGDGKLSTLLTANYSFINGPLAAYYGAGGVTGNEFRKVTMPAGKASGILTQAGFLATHATSDNGMTSLVFRGKFVREELLCTIIPDPPANAELENPPFTDKTTSREWAELRMAKPVCGTCHQVMDPIGFTMENFDPAGKWRDQEKGKPVNAHGALTGTDQDGELEGVVELGQKLARSKDVAACVSTQWFRFAAGRGPEGKRDDCTLGILQKSMADSGGDLRQLLVAYTQTDAFLFRSKGDAP